MRGDRALVMRAAIAQSLGGLDPGLPPLAADALIHFVGLGLGLVGPYLHEDLAAAKHAKGARRRKEFYFFLKPALDVVAYDATISGGLFADNKGEIIYDTKPLVFSQEIGIAYSKQRWTVDFSLLFKTKEVKKNIEIKSIRMYY